MNRETLNIENRIVRLFTKKTIMIPFIFFMLSYTNHNICSNLMLSLIGEFKNDIFRDEFLGW